ncbi:TetR family transcriptional regulator [Corynebacterium sp. CNCTC7651]|uniref:TetR family transcriptional regulator n=1 Tax=Corynebacterium sp. CNCTC7651 TaxID=2815361 RepID=UPI001F400DC9|nr:TetR family transcriptional regulator [Corynebacterium sp. CNCTC7651]UIZ92159.1 TetR family transcriptional regulator [Corynebacterium sp. CNCTC7651]
MTRALSAEQLLAIADEFCAATKARVRSFPALAACAAIPGARIHGVPACGSEREAGLLLYDAILNLKPLTSHNAEFGAAAREVYWRWVEGT